MYIEIKRKISISVLQIFSKEHSANIPPRPRAREAVLSMFT